MCKKMHPTSNYRAKVGAPTGSKQPRESWIVVDVQIHSVYRACLHRFVWIIYITKVSDRYSRSIVKYKFLIQFYLFSCIWNTIVSLFKKKRIKSHFHASNNTTRYKNGINSIKRISTSEKCLHCKHITIPV